MPDRSGENQWLALLQTGNGSRIGHPQNDFIEVIRYLNTQKEAPWSRRGRALIRVLKTHFIWRVVALTQGSDALFLSCSHPFFPALKIFIPEKPSLLLLRGYIYIQKFLTASCQSSRRGTSEHSP